MRAAERSRPMQTERPNPVPLCDLRGQYQDLRKEIEAAVSRVLASGQVILGPETAALEREVADYCGVAHAVGCGSGTDAISLALHGMSVGPGDEVILPTFTFFATAGCVLRAGATPVFADIDPATFNIDPAAVALAITPRTRAIMPVHLYGQCADMAELWAVGAEHGVPIIEDAAQAFGSEYYGKRTGRLGAIACFSFYPTKTLGTFGDAGMAVTDDAEWADRMATLRVHGMKPKYLHGILGWNARIDALHAAILRVKLPHVERWITARRSAALRYDDLISLHKLEGFLIRPVVRRDRKHTFNQYVVRVTDGSRDALVRHFQARGIGCEIYYPRPVHLQECVRHLHHKPGDFPASEAASREVLALPMFPEIAAEQQSRVIETIAAFRTTGSRLAA
jgi:dTDP-4-amino-4,6-dideoxygalactose transaminase